MKPIDTETIRHEGRVYRIRFYADADPPNPLEDWSEMGQILSLDRRHANFDPEGVASAIADHPDAVKLSYFEHGQCLWSVAGDLPSDCRRPFDSVPLAGVWLPDADTLESAARYGGRTRRHFMRKRARRACDAYTRWCNGEVYGYAIERVTDCTACGGEHAEAVDRCGGFFDLDDCRGQARAACSATRGVRRAFPISD